MNLNKKKNSGFTLVEMVIVIAISAILVSLITFSINLVKSADSQSTARRLEHLIKTARIQSMTKGVDEGKLTISLIDGAYYTQIGTGAQEFLCSQQSMTITGTTDIKEATSFTAFTVAHIDFKTSGKLAMYGTEQSYCKLRIDSKGKDYEIVIYPETGSVTYHLMQ